MTSIENSYVTHYTKRQTDIKNDVLRLYVLLSHGYILT